jgi:biopolymer transport protein ExbD
MGGAAAEPSSKGGKKSLDANINLVPYIDMLMTIMTFLMMTAVWTQIAMLEVQNAAGGAEAQPEEPDPNKPKAIMVLAGKEQVVVQEEGGEARPFPKTADGYDWKGIQTEMTRLKDVRPDRTEVKIQAEDGVQYEALAKLIDMSTGTKTSSAKCPPPDGSDKAAFDACGLKQITLTPMGQ